MKELSIYIHIPFCKSKCRYCSFYSMPLYDNSAYFEKYAEILIKEIKTCSEKYSLSDSRIKSIYFGGGTPSVMPEIFFKNLTDYIYKNFKIQEGAEITAEINPESGCLEKLSALKSFGINRLSIGTQSFNDAVLKTAGRIHTAKNIYDAVNNAKKAGIKNISLDLILGLPGQTDDIFQNDIEKITDINPKHISAYMLSIESGTMFYKIYNEKDAGKNGFRFICDEKIAEYYETLCKILEKKGYHHYEISNFSKNGYESRHNMNYWKRGEYLGLGPSASSFLKLKDGKEIRKTNISDLDKFAKKIENQEGLNLGFDLYLDKNLDLDSIEVLTEKDKINEEIFLSLRTSEGINAKRLSELTVPEIINNLINEGFMQNYKENIALTLKGMLLSSEIFARVMI